MCPPRSALWDLGLPTPSATRGETGFTGVSKPRSYYKAPIAYIFILHQRLFVPILDGRRQWQKLRTYGPDTFVITNFHIYERS